MPELSRLVAAPSVVNIGHGTLNTLSDILADPALCPGSRIVVIAGKNSSQEVTAQLRELVPDAAWMTAENGTEEAAQILATELRTTGFDLVIGVGGGRILDIAKFVAAANQWPSIAIATNLAHDGLASPVSILDAQTGRTSVGVTPPVAVIVDLDLLKSTPPAMLSAGIGDILSNISAIADWELAHEATGETVDGVAVALARTAADTMLFHPGAVQDDDFLIALAESLVLSGIAMTMCGSSRPCSGACHEISHAIDQLFPEKSKPHGFQVGVGAVFASFLRGDQRTAQHLARALRQHAMPVLPEDLGLTTDEFIAAVVHAPSTRPGRYTILEHLDLSHEAIGEKVREFVQAFH